MSGMRKVILRSLVAIVSLSMKDVIFVLLRIGALLSVFYFLFFKIDANARLGMFMLLAIGFVIWALLRGIFRGKTSNQEGYEACKKNIPKSNNPYLKPNTENEDMEAAELWFTGYIKAEKERESKGA